MYSTVPEHTAGAGDKSVFSKLCLNVVKCLDFTAIIIHGYFKYQVNSKHDMGTKD